MVARLILVAVLSGSPLGPAGGFEGSGARTLELRRDLRTVRTRVERAPRAASFDLQGLERRVHAQRTERPRDPKLQELALELDRLRAKADRAARRSTAAVLLSWSAPRSASAPTDKPGHLGGRRTPVEAPPARPYLGQRMVAMQRNAAEIERRLEHGDTMAAARLLEAVEDDLATLRVVFSSLTEDPNLIALEGQIRALEHRLEGH